MTVFVDDMCAPFGRMKMCHMVADTEQELHEMAAKIGVSRKWYQDDHYDVCLSMKAKALVLGAKECTWRECALMTMPQRIIRSARLCTPAEGKIRLEARVAKHKKEYQNGSDT